MKHDLTLWYSEYLIAETALITPLSRQTSETCIGSLDTQLQEKNPKI
jgi:hypothetical protein